MAHSTEIEYIDGQMAKTDGIIKMGQKKDIPMILVPFSNRLY